MKRSGDQGDRESNDPGSGGSDEGGGGGGGGGGPRPGLLGQNGCTKTQRHISGLNLDSLLTQTVRFQTHTQRALCKCSMLYVAPFCLVYIMLKCGKKGECINKTCFREGNCSYPQRDENCDH